MMKLNRFRNLSTNINIHLFKALIKPHLEYPIIPLCLSSKYNIQKLQSQQNICLRRACKDIPPYDRTMEDIHNEHSINPINIVMRDRAETIWAKLCDSVADFGDHSDDITNNRQDHHNNR